ncbi:MAG: DUF1565 domain-containing protein, partial [Bacteroidales bacterium]
MRILLHSKILLFCFVLNFTYSPETRSQYANVDTDVLPYGDTFNFWEQEQQPSTIYHVAQRHPDASDDNPGTSSLPFKTISRAASVLKAGEKVIIYEGIYRETIHPENSGTGPGKMIIYEGKKGDRVEV